jgi:peptidylprolyl isomerase
MRRRLVLAACPLVAAVVIAGCGGSSNPDTANIQAPPSASQTLTFTATHTSTGPTGATGPTIVTPKTGALSSEPKITVPSGPAPTTLIVRDLIVGTGAEAKTGDTVTVNYVGALYKNAKVFDASWNRNQTFPFTLGVGEVIPGWDKGLTGMRVGGRRELIIPSALGYGKNGSGTAIPPNAALVFIVDLLAVKPAAGSTGTTGATIAPGAVGTTGSTGAT